MTLAPAPPDLETRRDTRWRAVAGEHGIASLRHTHWLDDQFRTYPDAPGTWAARDGQVIGLVPPAPDAAPEELALSPGDDVLVESLRLRAISRDGVLALRVFDPGRPHGRIFAASTPSRGMTTGSNWARSSPPPAARRGSSAAWTDTSVRNRRLVSSPSRSPATPSD